MHLRSDPLVVALTLLALANACTSDDTSGAPEPRDAGTQPALVDGGQVTAADGGRSDTSVSDAGQAGAGGRGAAGSDGGQNAGGRPAGASGTGSPSDGDASTPAADDDAGRPPTAADAGSADAVCQLATPTAAAVASGTVWLVVDGSGSMFEVLGTQSRWTVLRSALIDAGGIVKTSEHEVDWGLMLYDGPNPGGTVVMLPDGGIVMPSLPAATTCPRSIVVEPKPDNFASIDSAYPNEPLGGSTPTDRALAELLMRIPSSGVADAPISVVLATDGLPNDFCSMEFLPPDVQPKVIDAVRMLATRGVKTYVISLAGDDEALTQHLNAVAAAGNTGHQPFLPESSSQLAAALSSIVNREPGCELQLDRAIALDQACTGSVTLAGERLACDAADGFTLLTPTRLRLQGEACEVYKTSGTAPQLSYPCSVLR